MSDRTFERAVLDWLEDGSDRTPRPAIDAVLLAVKTTPQERDLRIPWRTAQMNPRLGAAALVAIVVVGAVGVLALRNGTASPGTPTAGPSAAPSATIGSTTGPTPGSTLAFTTAFASATYGYDARAPEGWQVTLGTAQGSAAELSLGEHGAAARLWDHVTFGAPGAVGSGIFGTSTILPGGTTEDAWINEYQAPQVAADGRKCIPARPDWDAFEVDDHSGGIYAGCNYAEAMVFVDGRVYVFYYVNMTASSGAAATAGREILEAFLATVSLHPERAASASSAP